MEIQFKCDADLLVKGPALVDFGSLSERTFDKGEVVEVKALKDCPPPDSDMVDVTFMDGATAPVLRESFEVLGAPDDES